MPIKILGLRGNATQGLKDEDLKALNSELQAGYIAVEVISTLQDGPDFTLVIKLIPSFKLK
jgi:hypothetical protein